MDQNVSDIPNTMVLLAAVCEKCIKYVHSIAILAQHRVSIHHSNSVYIKQNNLAPYR